MNRKEIKQQIQNLDTEKILAFIAKIDKNFETLSGHHMQIQENQLEFEKYLKAILDEVRKK